MNRIFALIVSVVVSGSTLLCACDSKPKETSGSTAGTTVEATTETTTEAMPEETETTTSKLEVTIPDTPYEKVTLDGVKEHHFISTDYCYIEADKFVLLLDKDIDLPGDFVENVSAIIDEIENQLGVSYAPTDYDYPWLTDNTVYYGFNPWENWHLGTKIPIFLMVDREDEGMISCASASSALFVLYELFSDDFWNSVPSYRDNAWRKPSFVDYETIAHELTHTITLRNCDLTQILAEGIAQYMGVSVVDALAEQYPSIGEFKENRFDFDFLIPEPINASNAEATFISDYSQIDYSLRGAEYTYGKYLWMFLREEYGSEFFSSAAQGFHNLRLSFDPYSNYDEAVVTKYADVLKSLYGDDVFTRFGKWCTKNGYLQDT